MVVLHIFIGYLLLSNDVLSGELKKMVANLRTETGVYRAVQIFVYCFNLLLLVVVITDKT